MEHRDPAVTNDLKRTHYQSTVSLGNLLSIATMVVGLITFALRYENRLTTVENLAVETRAEQLRQVEDYDRILLISADVAVLRANIETLIAVQREIKEELMTLRKDGESMRLNNRGKP
jgi:hypothetical protein